MGEYARVLEHVALIAGEASSVCAPQLSASVSVFMMELGREMAPAWSVSYLPCAVV